jgi:hypothetical protein
VLATLGIGGYSQRSCPGQQASAEPAHVRGAWAPLGRALNATASTGVPTVVIVTSPAEPASLQLCRALATSPEVARLSGSFQFAEMGSDLYKAQVQKLGIQRFPTVIVYRRGARGVEAAASTSGLSQPTEVVHWLGLLELATRGVGTADAAIVRAAYGQAAASGQAYPTEQAPSPNPPSKQPVAPPTPPYVPPPPVYAPPPVPMAPPAYQAPYPAPAPVYLQPPAPTMVVQQAPQQIVLAPAPPPQITVAMAPPTMPTVSYAPPTANAPPPNLFTQPAMAPPAAAPPAAAPPAQPVMMAPVAMAPPAQAPQVGQGPITTALAMTLINPSLINRILGAIGEHLAQKKNPRIQMAQAPAMGPAPAPAAQAPIAYAPVGQAPAAYGYAPVGQAPYGYAPMTGYVPVTPEATFFAPCNTFRAPCKYHGGPCPGPGPQYAPPPSGPAASPQGGAGYAPAPAPHAPNKGILSGLWGH